MAKKLIELKDVWKIYQMGEVEVPALKGINIDIYEKEYVSIIGASGSGKSTTMNMIGCLDIPTKGKIYLNNINIKNLSESKLSQIRGKQIGFIFQTFNLIPSLNAIDNVTLPMIFQDVSQVKRKERAKKLLEDVGLKHRINHKPSQLSGGERQRVAVARSLANDPKIILADEPTGNLDTKNGKQIMEILRKLHKDEDKTIILVTHDLNLAKGTGRKIKLKDGMVIK